MKHAGKARKAGFKMLYWTFGLLVLVLLAGFMIQFVGSIIAAAASVLFFLWFLFAVFVLNFFRDPNPKVPAGLESIVSPAHGKVDIIDETTEPNVMGGACKRISIFLSVFDVHVQNTPVAGKITFLTHSPGKFLNAMKTECSTQNENVLVGFETSDPPALKIAVRLIAGLLARRIIPWVSVGETVAKGERLSLIQFGSRVDLYLPLHAQVAVKLGDKVKGGETVMATLG